MKNFNPGERISEIKIDQKFMERHSEFSIRNSKYNTSVISQKKKIKFRRHFSKQIKGNYNTFFVKNGIKEAKKKMRNSSKKSIDFLFEERRRLKSTAKSTSPNRNLRMRSKKSLNKTRKRLSSFDRNPSFFSNKMRRAKSNCKPKFKKNKSRYKTPQFNRRKKIPKPNTAEKKITNRLKFLRRYSKKFRTSNCLRKKAMSTFDDLSLTPNKNYSFMIKFDNESKENQNPDLPSFMTKKPRENEEEIIWYSKSFYLLKMVPKISIEGKKLQDYFSMVKSVKKNEKTKNISNIIILESHYETVDAFFLIYNKPKMTQADKLIPLSSLLYDPKNKYFLNEFYVSKFIFSLLGIVKELHERGVYHLGINPSTVFIFNVNFFV